MGQSRSVSFFSDSDFHGREGKIPNLLAETIGFSLLIVSWLRTCFGGIRKLVMGVDNTTTMKE